MGFFSFKLPKSSIDSAVSQFSLTGWPSKTLTCSYLHLPGLGVQKHSSMPGFYVSIWHQSQSLAESTLPTKLFPQTVAILLATNPILLQNYPHQNLAKIKEKTVLKGREEWCNYTIITYKWRENMTYVHRKYIYIYKWCFSCCFIMEITFAKIQFITSHSLLRK